MEDAVIPEVKVRGRPLLNARLDGKLSARDPSKLPILREFFRRLEYTESRSPNPPTPGEGLSKGYLSMTTNSTIVIIIRFRNTDEKSFSFT